jgi:predicted ATPase
MADDRSFRRDFFRQVADHPLEPNDPRYQVLYEPESDVILHLKETIDFSEGRSTQLLSGYRGAGKSTELRRLRNLLRADGHVVLLIDIEDFLDLHTPIDITTFLLALCGAIGQELRKHLVGDVLKAGLGERLWNFLKSEVKLKELSLTAKAGGKAKTDDGEVEGGLEAAAKLELKTNPLFRQKIQESLSLSLGHFVAEVRGFIAECVTAVRQQHHTGELIVLVDSIEHARGTNETEAKVHESLERLFADHDEKLKLPGVHLVYTVPPWLRIRRPNIGSPYSGAGLYTLPAQKVWKYEGDALEGTPFAPGIERLTELVGKRGDWKRLLGSEAALEQLILETGGHLRDLIRLLQTVAIEARTVPASAQTLTTALERLRAQFTPIPHEDVRWLARIARTRSVEFDNLGNLARYFDSHMVLCYQNGTEWYDVHPIVRDWVLAQAERLAEREVDSSTRSVAPDPIQEPSEAPPLTCLTHLHVEQYRSVARADLVLSPVTVLFGPNGAGKSSLLDALRLLHDCLTRGIEQAAMERSQALGMLHDGAQRPEVRVSVGTVDLDYTIQPTFVGGRIDPQLLQAAVRAGAPAQLPTRQRNPLLSLNGPGNALHHLLQRVRFHHGRAFDLAGLRGRGSAIGYDTTLQLRGDNLWSVLRNLHDRRESDPRYDRVIFYMTEAFPADFQGLSIEQSGQASVDGRFRLSHRREPVPAIGVSDGHLQMLLLLTVLFGPASSEPALWLLDEPEISLHPHAVTVLADALREATTAPGHQVVLATQSPVLLSQFELAESYVIELVQGATRARRLSEMPEIADLLEQYAAGSLYMAGELGRQAREP